MQTLRIAKTNVGQIVTGSLKTFSGPGLFLMGRKAVYQTATEFYLRVIQARRRAEALASHTGQILDALA